MGLPGPAELVVIGGILLVLIGIPVAIVLAVVMLSRRKKDS